MIPNVGIHKLTWDEKRVYGDCPVCDAKHGEKCRSNVGIMLGLNALGQPPSDGVHFGRLQNAPNAIRVEAV